MVVILFGVDSDGPLFCFNGHGPARTNGSLMELSIIFPAYNEGAVIRQNLLQVKKKLEEEHLSWEIIVVDDGSTDDTLRQAQGL